MPASFPNIKLDNFEGPFDLLLELARAKKIDLTKISLSKITDSFLQYMNQNKIPSIIQADFAIVAATLLLIKLKRLLPSLTEQEEEEINELTDRVRIYQLYRSQALSIQKLWLATPLLPGPEQLSVRQSTPFPNYTPMQLKDHFNAAIKKIKTPINKTKHLRTRGRSLQSCLALLTDRINRVKKLWFHDATANTDPHTTAVSFLALLELARRRQVTIDQSGIFQPISITKSKSK